MLHLNDLFCAAELQLGLIVISVYTFNHAQFLEVKSGGSLRFEVGMTCASVERKCSEIGVFFL
jgi:hypothetical protein